jgi:hypothetical protein
MGTLGWSSARRESKVQLPEAITELLEMRTLLSAYTPHILASYVEADAGVTREFVRDSSGDIFTLTEQTPSSGGPEAIYELVGGSGPPTLVATFPDSDIRSLSIDSSGDLFGVDYSGNSAGGTVWEIPRGSNSINTLAGFTSATTGSDPTGSLAIDSSGDVFGTTQLGGTDGGGTVWELPHGSGSITALASFQQSVSNNDATGLTLDSHGNLFGTFSESETVSGVFGGVWELPSGSSTVNVLASFDGANGSNPRSPLLIDSDGDIFGETDLGGTDFNTAPTTGLGTIFEIASGSNTITPLAFFSGANGEAPSGGLVADASGDLFGSTQSGGNVTANNPFGGDGVVFELPQGSNTIQSLLNLTPATTGSGPEGGVVLNSSGDIFTATASGGSGDGGTVLELTPGGSSGGGGATSSNLTATLTGKIPSSAIAGQKVSISPTLTVTDSSSTPVSGKVSAELFLSSSTTIDSSSIAIPGTTKSAVVKLKSHAHATLALKASSLPASIPSGTYHLIAQITDPSGNILDAPSSGTITIAPPQIDLTGAFSKQPVPGKGGKTAITFSVTNLGNIPATGPLPFDIDTSPNQQVAGATVVTTLTKPINLKPHGSTKITETVTLPAGTYFLLIQLDPNNKFHEVNLANNLLVTGNEITI